MKHRMPKLVCGFRPLHPQHTPEEPACSKLKHSVLVLHFSKILLRSSNVIGNRKFWFFEFGTSPTHLQSEDFHQVRLHLPLDGFREKLSSLFRLELVGENSRCNISNGCFL